MTEYDAPGELVEKKNSKSLMTIKLDFFLDLKVSLKDLQRLLSVLHILAFMSTKAYELNDMPVLEFTLIETDSIYLSINTDKDFVERFKELIVGINKARNYDKLTDDSVILAYIKRFYTVYTDEKWSDIRFLLLHEFPPKCVEDLGQTIFIWARKFTAINGKPIDEKLVFLNKEEVLETFVRNKKDLSGCSFSEIELNFIELTDAILKDSDFIKTQLMKANLEFSDAENANFTEANLTGATFANAKIDFSNFSRAHLMEANLSETTIKNSQFTGALLIGANLRRSNLSGANLEAAVLARSDASKSFFNNANGKHSSLIGVNAVEANFSEADFSYADFTTARLQGSRFENTCLFNSKLLNTNLQGVTRFNSANFEGADWWNAAEISDELLKYLRTIFPCSMEEDERLEHYKSLYNNEPSVEDQKNQCKLLGIEFKEAVEEEEDEFASIDSIDDIDLDPSQLTPENLAKLAEKFIDK